MNGRILISVSSFMVQCATFGIFGSGGGLVMGCRQTLKHCPQPHFILQIVREARESYISVIHPCRGDDHLLHKMHVVFSSYYFNDVFIMIS